MPMVLISKNVSTGIPACHAIFRNQTYRPTHNPTIHFDIVEGNTLLFKFILKMRFGLSATILLIALIALMSITGIESIFGVGNKKKQEKEV